MTIQERSFLFYILDAIDKAPQNIIGIIRTVEKDNNYSDEFVNNIAQLKNANDILQCSAMIRKSIL